MATSSIDGTVSQISSKTDQVAADILVLSSKFNNTSSASIGTSLAATNAAVSSAMRELETFVPQTKQRLSGVQTSLDVLLPEIKKGTLQLSRVMIGVEDHMDSAFSSQGEKLSRIEDTLRVLSQDLVVAGAPREPQVSLCRLQLEHY